MPSKTEMSDRPTLRIEADSLCGANGAILLRNVDLAIPEGAKVGVVGPRDVAASVLLEAVAGPDANRMHYDDQGPSVGYLAPQPSFDGAATVAAHAGSSTAPVKALFDRYDYINRHHLMPVGDDMHKWLAELETIEKSIKAMGGWGLDTRMTEAQEALRCPLPKTLMSEISPSARRRVDLCRLLVWRPSILVLDDPTADLDAECVAWLEQSLSHYKGTVVFASQDRGLLNAAAGALIVIEGSRVTAFDGGYTTWLDSARADPEDRAAIEHELDWIREGMPGRRASAAPGASRFQRWLARRGERSADLPALSIAPGPALGDEVIEVRGAARYAGEQVLFDNVSVSIPQGAVVGVIGAEGAGKTSLLRLLAGLDAADEGTVRIDGRVVLGHVDVNAKLDPDANLLRTIAGGRSRLEFGEQTIEARRFAAAFGFTAEQLDGPVGALSEVMRYRIHIAQVVRAGVNVLILDESTRDFDTGVLRRFEDAILRFVGCVIVATNDRWFLNRVATHLLAFEGDSRVALIEGNYDSYFAGRMRRAGLGTLRPHRLRFKRRAVADAPRG